MPSFVVKPKRDEDFYVLWSTVVDAPEAWGTRTEMLDLRNVNEERLARADEYGTSMCDPALPRDGQWFGWDDHEFLVMEIDLPNCRDDGVCLVPRENVRALCERLAAAEDPTDLLRFEPDEAQQ